ncbi:MAG: hypothetical protein ABR955_07520 [Verrucomicrobiota bacterium]
MADQLAIGCEVGWQEGDQFLAAENHQRMVGKSGAVIVHVIAEKKEGRVLRGIDEAVPLLPAIFRVSLDRKFLKVGIHWHRLVSSRMKNAGNLRAG